LSQNNENEVIPEEFDEFSETHESQDSTKKVKINNVLMNQGKVYSKFKN
jgi:hypothetical protein